MKKITLLARLAGASAILATSLGLAATGRINVPDQLLKTIRERYPSVEIVDAKPSPVAGIYEFYTGTTLFYTDASGDHLFAGPLIDTKTRLSLTAEGIEARNTIDFSVLPLDMAIKEVKGNGKRVMAVFADPDCPFCQRLEKALASVDNVTV